MEQISVLADLRQKEGDFRKAEALYRAQELRRQDPDLLTGIYSLLAHLYDRWGRMDKAAEFYELARPSAPTMASIKVTRSPRSKTTSP